MNDSASSGWRGDLPARSRVTGLVPFLFGAADRAEIPGPVLNRLLGDLGLSTSAARALLARMRQRGQLSAHRQGRQVGYRLAGELARGFQRVRTSPERVAPEWTGALHTLLYQVPEAERPYRDQLRRNARMLGYGVLQPGVLIAPADRTAALADTLARRPAEAVIYTGELRLDLPAARAAAHTAWALGEVAEIFRRHDENLRRALATAPSRPPADASSLRALADLVNEPLIDTMLGPDLPAELLADDWPLPRLHEQLGRAHQRYGPPATDYVRALLP